MNNNIYIAKITWIKPSDGGRQSPIPLNNKKYCPIISVDGQKYFSGSSYSVICNSFKVIEKYETIAYIRYLNTEKAPKNLQVGSKIELFEGLKLVATGEIISESDFNFIY